MPRSIRPKDKKTYRGYFSAYRAGILNTPLTEDMIKDALEHKIGQKVSPESRIAKTTILKIEDKGIRISMPSKKSLITYEQILDADKVMRFYLPDEIPNADTSNGGRNNDFRKPESGTQASHINNSGYAPALAELVWRELCNASSDTLRAEDLNEHDCLLSEEFGYSPEQVEFKEAKNRLRIHLTRERNRPLVKLAKQRWSRENQGDILCSICSFSFTKVYGDIGENFIEAHHKIPISELKEETIMRIEDLEPLCSNCHRIIHRRRPWLTVDELRNIWHKNQLNTG